MTKLTAVNICLNSVGENKITSLLTMGIDATEIADILDEHTAYTQDKGWTWNREWHLLSPDNSGFINLPSNCLRANTYGQSRQTPAVQRGLRMFDQINNTFVWTVPLNLQMYISLPFDLLPAGVKNYITYASAAISQNRLLGSDAVDAKLEKKAGDAWNSMLRDDIFEAGYNMLSGSNSVRGVLNRGNFNRGGL